MLRLQEAQWSLRIRQLPLLRVNNLVDGLGRNHFTSTLGFTKGYWQVAPATTNAFITA